MPHPIQEYLDKHSMGVDDFAPKARLTVDAVYKIINGDRKRPREKTITNIVRASNNEITRIDILNAWLPEQKSNHNGKHKA